MKFGPNYWTNNQVVSGRQLLRFLVGCIIAAAVAVVIVMENVWI